MPNKMCRICGKRRISTDPDMKIVDLCDPCFTRAGWENTHSDDDHDGFDGEGVAAAQITAQMAECWICHPELDESAKEPRKGHRNTVARSWNSHATCDHPRTPKARAKCRKDGGPKPPTSTDTDETPVVGGVDTPAESKPSTTRSRGTKKAK